MTHPWRVYQSWRNGRGVGRGINSNVCIRIGKAVYGGWERGGGAVATGVRAGRQGGGGWDANECKSVVIRQRKANERDKIGDNGHEGV